jgi:hypothetical protein
VLRFGAGVDASYCYRRRPRISLTVGTSCVKASHHKQTDDYEKKATPPRAWFKPEGWREREEARNARVTPRSNKLEQSKPALVRN